MSAGNAHARGKAAHRRRLADLPYPEKVRIVVELQKIAAPILKARGVTAIPWRLTEIPRTAKETCGKIEGFKRSTFNAQR
ncbi:MAG: hypothetical protein RBT78_13290 [Kiritimatiellia bacterium]|jgi:hypothetical protein|nr:hypothetical protein [Kiritimatiellia bacterium]